jgi:putative FmdB family regulatory protein
MPSYDYKCNDCQNRFNLFFKTYADYDTQEKRCSVCNSLNVSRTIHKINVQASSRDYRKLSSGEMLSVLETGDSRQVGEMFQQIGAGNPALGKQYHDATQKLLDGEPKDNVEKTLKAESPTSGENKPAPPPTTSTTST